MSTEKTDIHELLKLCSQYWYDTGYEPFMERKNTGHTRNNETFCKCKGKYSLVENTKQILMILTHRKVKHPYINL
jgi:hypothetical protein